MLFPALLLVSSLATSAPAPSKDDIQSPRPVEPPNVLYTGPRFYLSAEGPVVEAILVRAGYVLAAGSLAEIEVRAKALSARYRVEELPAGVAVPGLQDAHGHVESYGRSLEIVDLVGVKSLEELVERVVARAARMPEGTWIEGRGWDQNLWPVRIMPRHGALSRAVPDHPVYLSRVDGHAAFVNLKALELAGLDGNIGDPVPTPGGEILVDEGGRATGVLIDTAMGLVGRHIPGATHEDSRRRILLAQEKLLSMGIVCAHDMGVPPSTVEILRELCEADLLKMRVIVYLAGNDGLPDEVLARYPESIDSGRVVVKGVKLMIDGALGSRGAAMLEDYSDRADHKGLMRFSVAELQALVERYGRAGLQPATHAIGDGANRAVLDAYELAMDRVGELCDLRPRLEHAQIVAPEDWPRLAILGVVPSMQPIHATSDMRWAGDRVGFDRIAGAYAWRRLAPDTDALAFGSDFPVESPDPLPGLYAARTRTDASGQPAGGFLADQRLSGAEALAGFTSGAARAIGEEDHRGRLLRGYRADLTVLDVDPVTCEPAALLEARVLLTMVDGEIAYRAETR